MAVRSIRFGSIVAIVTILAACSAAAAPSVATQATAQPTAAMTASAPPSSPPPEPSPSPAPPSSSPTASPTRAAEASKPPSSPHARPSIDSAELAAYLTANFSLFDVAEESVVVTVTYEDPDSGPLEFGSYPLGSGEQFSHAVPPGAYRITFRVDGAAGKAPTCAVEVKDGFTFTFFVASADAIAVTRTGYKAKKPADLFVATSSLCKA
jgi:hypothetical protein